MFESVLSSFLGKYPLLEFAAVIIIVVGGIYTIWRGERQKRDRAAILGVQGENRFITELDLARFEDKLKDEASLRRKGLYKKLDELTHRLTVAETNLAMLLQQQQRRR